MHSCTYIQCTLAHNTYRTYTPLYRQLTHVYNKADSLLLKLPVPEEVVRHLAYYATLPPSTLPPEEVLLIFGSKKNDQYMYAGAYWLKIASGRENLAPLYTIHSQEREI